MPLPSTPIPPFQSLVENLFHTKTIGPSYKPPHILYVLYIIGQQTNGVGRYRIREELGLGEGSVKTLLNRLKDEGVIQVKGARQRGHVFSPKGWDLYHYITEIISFPKIIDNKNNEYVIGSYASYCLLNSKYLVDNFGNLSVTLRDEAIKIGGTGCSTLEFNGKNWFFLDSSAYLLEINLHPDDVKKVKKGSVLVIGGGNTPGESVLATLAASLRLIKSI